MDRLKEVFKDRLFRVCIISGLIWTLLSHGMALFNKYSYHDDIAAFNSVGSTYRLGRWTLGVMDSIVKTVMGGRHYSISLINGLITALCISLIVYLIAKKTEMTVNHILVLVVGVMISFPAITGIFGYIFTAPYYYFGALLGVLGAYIFYEKFNVITMIISMTLMAFAVGTYQANIPICICTLLIFMLNEVFRRENSWKEYWILALKNIFICVGFMVEYFLINNYFLNKYNIALSEYRGIKNFGQTTIIGYFSRVLRAYKEFFNPTDDTSGNMFPFSIRYVHIILVGVTVLLAVSLCYQLFKKDKAKSVKIGIIIALYPLAAYFIYVMVDFSEIRGLMTFGEAFTFILLLWIYDKAAKEIRFNKIMMYTITVLLCVLSFMYVRFSNICYLKAEMLQSQAISYFTTLVTQIKSTEGFSDETPIVYINEFKKLDKSFSETTVFEPIYIPPYQYDSIINNYMWESTMKFWCGFSPLKGDSSVFENDKRVAEMPSYPDSGSIRCIDGTIVVKFEGNTTN